MCLWLVWFQGRGRQIKKTFHQFINFALKQLGKTGRPQHPQPLLAFCNLIKILCTPTLLCLVFVVFLSTEPYINSAYNDKIN